MIRPIAIGLAPNLTREDAFLAFKKVISPSSYKTGNTTEQLEKWFENYFSVKQAVAFTSGRSALYAILSGLGIQKGDEVILQVFTCAAVIQAIITAGATPIYADITEQYTMDPKSLQKKITQKTKAIIIQHTFGIPANLNEILHIAKMKNIFVIEDSAHSIGSVYKRKKIGTFGMASIFSFGRDKAFSSTSGGIAITNNKTLGEKMKTIATTQGYPSRFWIFQQLFHPIAFYFFVLPLYNLLIGKIILYGLQRIKLLSVPVDASKINFSTDDIKKFPPVLSELVLLQLRQIERVNKERQTISAYYEKKLKVGTHFHQPLLRYPLQVENQQDVLHAFKKQNIYPGNWYSNIIDPKGVSLKKFGYIVGSCPKAEKIAKKIVNLPTYFSLSEKDIHAICSIVTEYAQYTKYTK